MVAAPRMQVMAAARGLAAAIDVGEQQEEEEEGCGAVRPFSLPPS